MTTLRMKIELNPGGEGVRMDKLAKLTGEAERFLRYLLSDLGVTVPSGEWVSRGFYNSSVGFTAELPRNVDEAVVGTFNASVDYFASFRDGKQTINGSYKPRTINQFVTLGKCLDADEKMRIGLYDPGAVESDEPKWRDLTRAPALELEKIVARPLVYHGSIQGRLGTWYKEGAYFDVREVTQSKLVKCHYRLEQYANIHALYEDKDTVVHVTGMVTAERLNGIPTDIEIERLKVYDRLSESEFNKLFGLFPKMTGDESTVDYIDRERGDGDS